MYEKTFHPRCAVGVKQSDTGHVLLAVDDDVIAIAPDDARVIAASLLECATACEGNPVWHSVRAASKDYNARGRRRHHWYRMVWRDDEWQYFGEGRLPKGTLRASERCASIHGEVREGEIVIAHDHGGAVDSAYRVRGDLTEGQKPLEPIELHIRAGKLLIDGVEYPDPRNR